MRDFGMLVIGSGSGGQRAAIAAARLGRRLAVVDRPDLVGGVSLHTGTWSWSITSGTNTSSAPATSPVS